MLTFFIPVKKSRNRYRKKRGRENDKRERARLDRASVKYLYRENTNMLTCFNPDVCMMHAVGIEPIGSTVGRNVLVQLYVVHYGRQPLARKQLV